MKTREQLLDAIKQTATPDIAILFWFDFVFDKYVNNRMTEEQVIALFTTEVEKGGPGSGNHGHSGRPGKHGGSSSGGGGFSVANIELANFTPEAEAQFREWSKKLKADHGDVGVEGIEFQDGIANGMGETDQIMMQVRGNTIYVNSQIVNGDLSKADAYVKDITGNDWVRHADFYDTLVHEVGHVKFPPDSVDRLGYKAEAVEAFKLYVGSYDEGKWFKYQSDEFDEKVKNDFSRYAATSMGEFLAEGYLYHSKGTLSGGASELMQTLVDLKY